MTDLIWIYIFLTALVGVLLFLACVNLLDKMIHQKMRIKEQRLLCAVLVFLFIMMVLFFNISLVE